MKVNDRITVKIIDIDDVRRRISLSLKQAVKAGYGEAPEIDGVVHVGQNVEVGNIASVEVVDALGPDLVGAGADLVVGDEPDEASIA